MKFDLKPIKGCLRALKKDLENFRGHRREYTVALVDYAADNATDVIIIENVLQATTAYQPLQLTPNNIPSATVKHALHDEYQTFNRMRVTEGLPLLQSIKSILSDFTITEPDLLAQIVKLEGLKNEVEGYNTIIQRYNDLFRENFERTYDGMDNITALLQTHTDEGVLQKVSTLTETLDQLKQDYENTATGELISATYTEVILDYINEWLAYLKDEREIEKGLRFIVKDGDSEAFIDSLKETLRAGR